MKIEIDPGAGPCFGVERAINMAEELLSEKQSVFCVGDLIHNANMAMLPTSLVGRIYKLSGIVSDHLLAGGGEIEKREAFEKVWIP